MKQEKTYKVGISGSYGGLNLGDEAILQSIVSQLRTSLSVEITVFSRNPEDTLARHRVDRAIPVRNLLRNEITPEIERLDLLILGGGGILFDEEAEAFLREVQLAHELSVPVAVYAVSAGPLKKRAAIEAVRTALSGVAALTVRDRESKRLLENIGVEREIVVTADPAYLLQPEPLPEELPFTGHPGAGSRRLVGMSVREPGPAAPDLDMGKYHELLANAADYMVDRFNADVVFVPMERRMLDLQHAHAVVANMLRPQHAWVVQEEYSAGQLLGLMSRFDLAVGMRLHFLIFAALRHIPFVPLPYSAKVLAMLEDFHIEMPPMELVNAGRLIAHLDHSWDFREELRARIERYLPEVQQRALETNAIMVEILRGQAGKTTAEQSRRSSIPEPACPS